MSEVPSITERQLREIINREPKGFQQGFYGGSRIICTPPVMDTDVDICILVEDVEKFYHCLGIDWETPLEDDEYDGATDTFTTFRRGVHNLLVFDDPTEFGAVLGMTAFAKNENIQSKEERYRMFTAARSPWR